MGLPRSSVKVIRTPMPLSNQNSSFSYTIILESVVSIFRQYSLLRRQASLSSSSISFNAFFNIGGQIITTNNVVTDTDTIWDFLDLGESDLEKIKEICIHYGKPVPTELKMIYDCKTGQIDTKYQYNSICSAKTGIDSSEIFLKWLDEVCNGRDKTTL